jgi:hypothetical protein
MQAVAYVWWSFDDGDSTCCGAAASNTPLKLCSHVPCLYAAGGALLAAHSAVRDTTDPLGECGAQGTGGAYCLSGQHRSAMART